MKIHNSKDINSPQSEVQIKCNFNQIPSKICVCVCRTWKANSKIYREEPNAKNIQDSLQEQDRSVSFSKYKQ